MLPALEGLIARRILLNFRAEPAVAQAAVPPPLEIQRVAGQAIVGVCLIRLEHIRPKGLPALAGLSSENMAHRFAIRFPGEQGREAGVFIPRRDTDSSFVGLLGGRLFPGYHHVADFQVRESPEGLALDVRTPGGVADVRLRARWTDRWPGSALFGRLEEASEFFRRAPCGFSCGRDGRTLEGLRLQTLEWRVEPLAVDELDAAYYRDAARFPPGSVTFDHGLVMRAVPHEWHELRHVPELVGDFRAEASGG